MRVARPVQLRALWARSGAEAEAQAQGGASPEGRPEGGSEGNTPIQGAGRGHNGARAPS